MSSLGQKGLPYLGKVSLSNTKIHRPYKFYSVCKNLVFVCFSVRLFVVCLFICWGVGWGVCLLFVMCFGV